MILLFFVFEVDFFKIMKLMLLDKEKAEREKKWKGTFTTSLSNLSSPCMLRKLFCHLPTI